MSSVPGARERVHDGLRDGRDFGCDDDRHDGRHYDPEGHFALEEQQAPALGYGQPYGRDSLPGTSSSAPT